MHENCLRIFAPAKLKLPTREAVLAPHKLLVSLSEVGREEFVHCCLFKLKPFRRVHVTVSIILEEFVVLPVLRRLLYTLDLRLAPALEIISVFLCVPLEKLRAERDIV